MPDLDDPDQEAKDHGNLMDLEVAEVERESAEVAGDKDHLPAGNAAERNGPSKPTGPKGVSGLRSSWRKRTPKPKTR